MQIFSNGNMTLIDTGIPVLRTMLLVEPFFAACIVMKMSLRGAGDTRRVMLVSYGIMGFFRGVYLGLVQAGPGNHDPVGHLDALRL